MDDGQQGRAPLQLLIRRVLVLGVLANAVAAAWWSRGPGISWSAALVVLVLVAIGDAVEMSARLGGHRVHFSSGEAMLLLAYVVGSPAAVVVLAALALAAGEAVRRQRSVLKAAYNVASASVAALVGAVVVAVGRAGEGTPGDWPLLALAAASVVVVQGLLISAAVARSTGSATWTVFARGHVHRLALWAANVLLAIGLLGAWRWNRSVIVGICLIALSGSGLLARFMRNRDELDVLRRLDLATRTLPGLDETEVLTSVCHQACALLGLDAADIVLVQQTGAGPGLVFSAAPGSPGVRREPDEQDLADAAAAAEQDLVTRVDRGRVVAGAALRAGDSHLGVLRVSLPSSRADESELHLLAALATTAGSAVLNARMFAAQQRQGEELRETAAREFEQARRDPLTGLGNRTWLLEHGEDCFRAHGRTGMLLLDLNHFKEVNDTLGHAAGDELLRRVAGRLRDHAGQGRHVARLGGDEFAVLVPAMTDPEALVALGHALIDRLREPITVDGLRLTAEASVGIAWAPEHATTVDELLRCADVAMYRAKHTNQLLVPYDDQRDDGAVERLEVLAALQAGLTRGELVVHYQPKVDLLTGCATGVEALCRWQHPQQGLLPPGRFMPVVEHSSVINELTEVVLRTATADAALLARSGEPLSVAVNVSSRCLLDVTFASTVASVLQASGLAAHQLVLEITETLALVELDTVERVLAELRGLGVRLSVDDFGTGYSSLTFLQRVDVHEVKIDQSFVRQMDEQQGAVAIVEATIGLAHRLGLVAVAEGVEELTQLDRLRRAGCDQVQGYLLGRPMPLADLQDWLRHQPFARLSNVIPLQREDEAGEVTA